MRAIPALKLTPVGRLLSVLLFLVIIFAGTLAYISCDRITRNSSGYQSIDVSENQDPDDTYFEDTYFENAENLVPFEHTNPDSQSADALPEESQDELTHENDTISHTPQTFPEVANPIVAFYADNQSDTDAEDENHQRVVDYILATDADPVFHAGDLMEDGTADSLNRFNSVTATLRSTRTFYAALGNNDRKIGDPGTPSQLFLDNFVFPNNEQWYSVNYGNLHLVVLDSAFSDDSEAQRSWLFADLLSDDSQNRITGVMFHHPTFAPSFSQQLVDLGVDFIVSGHYHSYGHSTSIGIHSFVLSGQPSLGYLIAEIFSDSVLITAYDYNNSVVESVLFNERACSFDKCTENSDRTLF